ncbi:MAG: hypothetical protein ACPGJS_15215 [Flammeovirgaceae bacterium]
MATRYNIDFINDTSETWIFCVYVKYPKSPGIKSVAWKQTTIPTKGESGVAWTYQIQACIVDYKQRGDKGVYKASQILDAALGQRWKCVFKEHVQQLVLDGNAQDGDQLRIANQSNHRASLGIGIDGTVAAIKENVFNDNSAQFEADPKVFVAVYKDLTRGEIISSNQIHSPIEVLFEGGLTSKTFRASENGATFVFREVS